MKRNLAFLLCVCLMAAALQSAFATADSAQPSAPPREAGDTLTCTTPDGTLSFWRLADMLPYTCDTITDAIAVWADTPYYEMLQKFVDDELESAKHSGPKDMQDRTIFLMPADQPVIFAIAGIDMSIAISDEDLLAYYDSLVKLCNMGDDFSSHSTKPDKVNELSLPNSFRWVSASGQFTRSTERWRLTRALGAQGANTVFVSMLWPDSQGEAYITDSSILFSSLAPAAADNDAAHVYGVTAFDEDKAAYYDNGFQPYVDITQRMMYAIPDDWIGLFPTNLDSEIASIAAMNKPYAASLAQLVKDAYDHTSATVLTADREGCLLSGCGAYEGTITMQVLIESVMPGYTESFYEQDGFIEMLHQPEDAADMSQLTSLTYEYLTSKYDTVWQVLDALVVDRSSIIEFSLTVHQGQMTDALRETFDHIIQSVQTELSAS